jgi:flagellar protein FliS
MTTDSANAYLRTKVMTASPEELRMMLLDGAIRFATQGREGLAAKNYEQSYNGLSQCRNIIVELMTSVKDDPDPALASRVRALFAFMYSELIEANLNKDVSRVDNVVRLLEFERETWAMLMQKLAAERGRGASPVSTGERPPISVQA